MSIPSDLIARARSVRIEDEVERRAIWLHGQAERRVNQYGPCPRCGGVDRFSINTRKLVLYCRVCEAKGDVIELVQFLDDCDFATAIETLTGRRAENPKLRRASNLLSPSASDDRANSVAKARRRWREAIDPRGTIVETYLAGRGLVLADDIAGAVIRFHPACPWKGDDDEVIRVPLMICAMRDIRTDELMAVSCRRLTPEGQKVGKPRFRGVAGGAAIKLDADENVTNGLHICEGVETGIAGRMLDLKPMWALGSKDAIKSFPVLGGIDTLTILAEPDVEASVEQCARRWYDAGREVIINRSRFGKDLADAMAEGVAHGR